MAKASEITKQDSFSTSGQVSRMISFFETKQAGEKPDYSTSPHLSAKVINFASTFGPIVDFGDDERVAEDNPLTAEGTSEMRNGDLNAQFSLVTLKSTPLSPQHREGSDFDKRRGANDYVATPDSNIGINFFAPKKDWRSRIQEFGKKEEVVSAASVCLEPRNASTLSFQHQKSEMKPFAEISGNNPEALFEEEAHTPDDASKRLLESGAVDEIQPDADNNSTPGKGKRGEKTVILRKRHASTGRIKPLKTKTKHDTEVPASRETIPETEAKTGRRKVFRRSRRERNSGVRSKILKGMRALKRILTRQGVTAEVPQRNQGEAQDKPCTISI